MIEEIKQIFNDIRDAIIEMGGDIDVCTSPEQYAEAIKALTGNTAVLCIPVFKSSELKPAKPVGTMSPADPTDYPEGWGTPDGLTGNVWMSYTMVSASTVYVPWTEPILMAQAVNPQPVNYDDATTRTFIICLELPTLSVTPTVPVGGTWNTVNNTLIDVPVFVYNGTNFYWSTDNDHIPGCYTWMSFGTFLAEDGSQIGTWSDPICINAVRDGKDGKDGRNGVDGTDIEFIYKLCHNETEAQLVETPYSDPDIDDYIPSPRYDQIGKGGWSDSPEGIDSDTWRVEIMCTRKKNVETGKWEAFVGPAIWSSWGEDGMDGDGVEYIFRVATNAEVTQDANGKYHLNNIGTWPPTCEETCANGFLTVARTSAGYVSDADALEAYQQDEFIPGDAEICPDSARLGWDRNWTDDPLDVDVNEPFEFVSIRKYDGTTEKWGWFSEPVLWNKYYVTSAPIFTSFAFCRSTKNLAGMTLTGGTVINPLPSDQTVDGELIHWYDSVPGAAEYAAAHDPNPNRCNAPIWMTSSKFGSADPSVVVSPNWASPKLMSDNRYFNSEYSCSSIDPSAVSFHLPRFDETPAGSSTTQPFLDPTSPEGVNESAWRTWCTNHGLGTWSDDESDPKWMATCTFENGLWSDWTVTQIKGEDGQDGQDGNDGNDGRGIVSIAIYYMWYNSGTSHPTADAQGWSSSIPSAPSDQTYKYLWKKTITTYTSSPLTETTYELISERGTRGPIGPKMRMRNWKTDYPNPDTEGQTGWLNGDRANDAFYDVAIYPIADEGITVTNASSNADRLWRCIQPLPYTTLATIISQAGDASLVYPGSTYLQGYFSQAVGWDFVATSLLLANRITADQIDVRGISTDTLVTTPEQDDPDSYIRAQGNNMILYKTGNPSCIITADPLTTNASDTVTKIWENPLGNTFLASTTENGIHFTTSLGQFRIVSPEQGQSADYLFSAQPQFISARVDGTLTDTVYFNPDQMAFFSHLYLNAINIDTGNIVGTWMTGGYIESLPYSTTSQTSFGPGPLQTGALFKLDTTQHFELQPGLYRLELTGDIITGWNPLLVTNYTFTIGQIKDFLPNPQDSEIAYGGGWHSSVAVHHTSTVNPQTTEIASDGFAHVLDSGNYFKLRHPIDNVGGVDTPDPDTLLMEFRVTDPNDSTKAFGIKVDKTGIYKWVYNAGTLQTGDWVTASL